MVGEGYKNKKEKQSGMLIKSANVNSVTTSLKCSFPVSFPFVKIRFTLLLLITLCFFSIFLIIIFIWISLIAGGVFLMLGYSSADEALLRPHTNLGVQDAVRALQQYVSSYIDNQVNCPPIKKLSSKTFIYLLNNKVQWSRRWSALSASGFCRRYRRFGGNNVVCSASLWNPWASGFRSNLSVYVQPPKGTHF